MPQQHTPIQPHNCDWEFKISPDPTVNGGTMVLLLIHHTAGVDVHPLGGPAFAQFVADAETALEAAGIQAAPRPSRLVVASQVPPPMPKPGQR